MDRDEVTVVAPQIAESLHQVLVLFANTINAVIMEHTLSCQLSHLVLEYRKVVVS